MRVHFLIGSITGIVLFIFLKEYIGNFTVVNDEEMAFALTTAFLGAVYAGRFVSQLWITEKTQVSYTVLIGLSVVLMVSCFFSAIFINKAIRRDDFFHDFFFLFAYVIMSFVLGMLIKLLRARVNWHLRAAQIQAAHSQSELQNLQSQLSPHFLFNTLNNLYGLSITTPDKVPALLLQLSDLLRYSVYDAKELFVPLKEELSYIHNYMEFEKIRIGERLHLNTRIDEFEDSGDLVAPMLLIVFIENAFKHSKNTTSEKIMIDMTIRRWSNSILFSVKNSKGEVPHEFSGGLGLDNVRKRLNLLYPNEHELNIDDGEKYFTVALQLKIKQYEKDQLSDRR